MSVLRCSGCGNEIVEIVMERSDRTFTLRSCSTCDERCWISDGETLPLTTVLAGINRAETES